MDPVERLKEILRANKAWVEKNSFFTMELPKHANGKRRAARIRFKERVVRVEALYLAYGDVYYWMNAGSCYHYKMCLTPDNGVRMGATVITKTGEMIHGRYGRNL